MSSSLLPAALRQKIRQGEHTGNTSGFGPGYVQCNVVILPAELAAQFLRFCQLNPKPCPLIAVGEPGNPALPLLGDMDIRTDVPNYRVFRDGVMCEETADISHLWRDDLVTFALGCSFSFEEALLADGLEVRNVSAGVNVPMYRTNIDCASAGPFAGKMVVSMRPFKAADAIRAVQICTRFPSVHGAPIHLGDPALIGIGDLAAAGLRRRGAALAMTSCRCSGPAVSLRRSRWRTARLRPSPSPTARVVCWSQICATASWLCCKEQRTSYATQLRPGRELRQLDHGPGRRGDAPHRPGQYRLRLPRRRPGDHAQDAGAGSGGTASLSARIRLIRTWWASAAGPMNLSADEIIANLHYQVAALEGMAQSQGLTGRLRQTARRAVQRYDGQATKFAPPSCRRSQAIIDPLALMLQATAAGG